MRILIIADIHGNLEAFQSVLTDAEMRGGFQQVISLGDVVGYGPNPSECTDLINQYDARAVVGNHDLASVGKLSMEAFNIYAREANTWTASQLSIEQVIYYVDLPFKFKVGNLTVVHGSPRDPVWEYVVSPIIAAANFSHFDTHWCLVGHSHIPFICKSHDGTAVFSEFTLDKPFELDHDRLIINPGGVGQPRDGDPRASYAIYDSDSAVIYHHRVEYQVTKTQQKMRDAGLPRYLTERLARGR